MRLLGEYREFLSGAGQLRERHQAARPRPFNVFAALRKPSDENHLHSRFLQALLEHSDPATGERLNLVDFVRNVAHVSEFSTTTARTYRESDRIDLLIANNVREAIIVENKIHARDRKEQLQRYYRTLVCRRGYDASAVHILYLTLFGSEPDPDSIGPFGDRLRLLSYRWDLPPWLTRCQQRAFDDPPLRESIAQYVDLVRRLTGTDYAGTYMTELKNLCKTADNMLLARDISRAFVEAQIDLVTRLWRTISDKMEASISDLPRDPAYVLVADRSSVTKTISGKRRHESGLHYLVAKDVWISVAATEKLWYGVYCEQAEQPEMYSRLKEALAYVGPTHYTESWTPWACVPEPPIDVCEPDDDAVGLLTSERSVDALASRIVEDVTELWSTLKAAGLHESIR